MKSLKRVFALAVVFAMVLSSMPMVMAATTFEDVTGADQNVVGTLVGLNIITGYDEDGTMLFKGDQTITRAEFATIVCRLIGMGDAAASQRNTDFADVPSTHWASGYIQTAADTNGIINGYGDGNFGPEDNVTYEQAVKMIVCALGYQTKAEEEGTYPAGYIFVARTIGLTDGVTGTVGQEASRMTVAKLLYNSLSTPLMQKIVSGTTSSYYGIFDGEEYTPKKTVLSEYLGAVKVTGILSNTSISSESLREDQVQIDIDDNFGSRVTTSNKAYAEGETITCYVGDTTAKSLLGKRVEAYLTFETSANNDPTVLAIFENMNENKKLSVEADDIIEMKAVDGAYSLKYWTDKDNNKSTTVYVKDTADYYVNGAKDASFTTTKLAQAVDSKNNPDDSFDQDYQNAIDRIAEILDSKYTVIDFSLVGKATGSYDYDYAFINIYDNFVVDSIDETAEKIYQGLDTDCTIGEIDYSEDAEYELSLVDVNGEAVAATDLTEYDVLTMQLNPYDYTSASDIKAVSAVLVQESVEGTVTEKNDVELEYYIDDEPYDMDPSSTVKLEIGDSGVFYLDANGNIVAFSLETSKASNYAVIVKAAKTNNIEEAVQVRMFTSEGALETKNLADKVRVLKYGEKTESKDDTAVWSDLLNSGSISSPIVCSYTLNSAGEVNSISVADKAVNYAAAEKSSALVANELNEDGEVQAENMEIKRIKAGSTYYMDANTKVIAMEKDSSVFTNPVVDNFEAYTADSFTADQDFNAISIFDTDSNRYAGFVFIYDADISLTSDAVDLAMVKAVNDVNDSEGNPTSKISAINRDGATSAVVAADYNNYDLVAGEVYYAKSANSNGELRNLVQVTEKVDGVFQLTEDFKDIYDATKDDSDSTYYFGKVTNKTKNTIEFYNILEGEEEALLIPNTTNVMVYDESRSSSNKVTSASPAYMTFATRPVYAEDDVDQENPIYKPSATGIESYVVLVREYNGQYVDVVFYCYTSDVTVELPDSTSSTVETATTVEDAVVDVDKIKEDDVIAE